MLSKAFVPATWYGTTNTDGRVIGISLETNDDSIARFALDIDSARGLAETILGYIGERTSPVRRDHSPERS